MSSSKLFVLAPVGSRSPSPLTPLPKLSRRASGPFKLVARRRRYQKNLWIFNTVSPQIWQNWRAASVESYARKRLDQRKRYSGSLRSFLFIDFSDGFDAEETDR